MIDILAAGLAATGALAVAGLAYRRSQQRRVARALRITTSNGIAEERFVSLGGIEQWVQIRGEDRDNPVLLVLHGGPGWPNALFTLPLRDWEKHFTVVHWDQRGAGKTFGRNGKAGCGQMTFDRRVTDGVELTEYLCRQLHVDQVILLAESMGTLVGTPLALRRPDLFSAYVATDLYVNMVSNEALKRELTIERLRAMGNTKGVAALQRLTPEPARWSLKEWEVNMAWAFKTNLPQPSPERSLLFPLLLSSSIYTLRDLYHLLDGFRFCTVQLFDEFLAYDARRLGTRFEIPFFLFQGESDVVTLTTLAQDYFAEVEAPVKGLAIIPGAGHFAAFTQPERFLTELLERVRPATTSSASFQAVLPSFRPSLPRAQRDPSEPPDC